MKFKYPEIDSKSFRAFRVRCSKRDSDKLIENLNRVRADGGASDICKTYETTGPTMFEIWIDTTYSKFAAETKLSEGFQDVNLFSITNAR